MDAALEEWLEREARYVHEALRTADAYVYAEPVDEDYVDAFIQQMERRVEERDFFLWYERTGKDLELEEDPGRRAPESLDEMFCDECGGFQFVVGVKGDAHYCSGCWDDLGLADQEQLTAYADGSEPARYALVGCGSDKQDDPATARDLYTSPYFAKKRRFAEELCGDWWIVSAKHGLLDPNDHVEPYERSIDDVDVAAWLDDVEEQIAADVEPDVSEGATEVWMLVGRRYLDAADRRGRTLRHVLNGLDTTVYYPFGQTEGQQWLDHVVEAGEPAMPFHVFDEGQRSLARYADDDP